MSVVDRLYVHEPIVERDACSSVYDSEGSISACPWLAGRHGQVPVVGGRCGHIYIYICILFREMHVQVPVIDTEALACLTGGVFMYLLLREMYVLCLWLRGSK